ncbi:efflux RND transporter permease subunit [Crocinitomicaceae bacterium]|nr:efflux RND transporter permease subunit [Crocinitomicaceae bacterium]
MRKFINFFLVHPIWGNAFIVLVLIFGIFSIVMMRKSFFPELDPKTININVFYSGASPSEMEEGVTIKIEQAVKGIDGIDEINSTSAENTANVSIKAFQDTDIEELLSEVENTVNSISSFPQGSERPIITRIKSGGMGSTTAFIGIAAKTENARANELTDLASKVERDLLNTKEITEIRKNGFPEKEIAINVRENDLLRYGMSIQEVSTAIASKNLDLTAGLIRGGVQEMSIRSNNRGTTAEEIDEIIIRTTRTGEKIVVGDIADVQIGYSENSQHSEYNGKPSVSFQIEKTPLQDISKITSELHKYKEKFNKENPDHEFVILFEFNEMLNQRIDLLTGNGLMGLILVLIFLGIFLNIKLSAWVAFGIPFSFLGMFIIGSVYGMSINMISLFGMILVVGILVDDGIVIAENIYSHFERGKTAKQAALDGTMEVLPSVFSSVLTTMVAFSVLLYVEGLEVMREMAFVVLACLAFSLIEAFIILPAHLGHKTILSEPKEPKYSIRTGLLLFAVAIFVIWLGSYLMSLVDLSLLTLLFPFGLFAVGGYLFMQGFSNSPLEKIVRGNADKGIKYVRDNFFKTAVETFVGKNFKMYNLTFFVPLLITVITIGMMVTKTIGFTFFPDIPPDFFNVEAAYKPGDNIQKTEKFIEVASEILKEENERIIKEKGDSLVRYSTSNIGFTSNLGQVGNHTGSLMVFLNNEGSSTPADTLMARVNRRINATEEGKLAQNINVGGFNRFGKEIEMGLTSSDENALLEAKELFKSELKAIPGVFNVKDNMPPGRFEVYLNMRPQAEIYGITKNEVLTQIRQGFFGSEAQRVIIGTDEVKVWVRFTKEDRNSLSDLENMRIRSAQGLTIPLKELCDFDLGRAPESLKRRNGQRIIKVDAECTDPDKVAEINSDIREKTVKKVKQVFPQIQTVSLGQFERSQKTGSSMMYVAIVALVIMFIVISLHFNNVRQSFLIMLVIPAGIAGAILGHGLIGIPVSILSVFGMIALTGVLVNDAIVFLDRYNSLLLEGYTVRKAALEAASSRFRPILLTSVTTVAGLLPMIAETSMQAQFLIPMASSIAFGVLFGTIFILFFYPSAIMFWNGFGKTRTRIWTGEKVTRLDVEPVIKFQRKKSEIH